MKLQKIAEQAKRYPAMVFNNVFHLIDYEFLREAYRQTCKSSAPGVDKVTAAQYAANLDENLRDLHERLRANRHVAPPVERVWITNTVRRSVHGRRLRTAVCGIFCLCRPRARGNRMGR